MSTYDIDQNYVNQSQQAMQGDFVSLPFNAAFFRWMNGQGQFAQTPDARFFGGWASFDEDTINNILSADESLNLPHGLERVDLVSRADSKQYSAYISRFVRIVPFGKRKRWSPGSHVQILCYLADFDPQTKAYSPWAPAVLSAKGYAGQRIEDALAAWDTITAKARREHAENLPAWFFYAMLGTFLEQPETEMVGKSGQQSPITPCKLPDQLATLDIEKKHLDAWYIGKEVADTIYAPGGLLAQAQEWLADWKDNDKRERDNSTNQVTPSDFVSSRPGQPEEMPRSGEEIPF